MQALILNDLHLGAVRSAGTTIVTRKLIQDYLQQQLRDTLAHTECDVILLGDIFDAFNVEMSQILQAYFTLADWMHAHPACLLHLVQGNHDVAKNSEKTSAFAFLCALLTKHSPDQARVYATGFAEMYLGTSANVYVVPHVLNQDLFDIELAKALEVKPGWLLLHANCMNRFAEQADHSLNVNEEWVNRLLAHGHRLVFAHEHQARTLKAGKVRVLGNQWPSSVADCLEHNGAQKDGMKCMHILDDSGLYPVQTWDALGDFVEIDWRALRGEEPVSFFRFIRVTGTATADEASEVIAAIAKYRQKSEALVITNAVRIEGIDGIDDMSGLTSEKLASVDVLAALMEELTPPEQVAVKYLLEDEQ
jgi:hypothetical protein